MQMLRGHNLASWGALTPGYGLGDIVPIITAPAQMDPPTLTLLSATEVRVTLADDPDDGGSPITTRGIRYSTDETNWTTNFLITSPHDVSGLTEDALYYVQARVSNAEGAGPWSDSAQILTTASVNVVVENGNVITDLTPFPGTTRVIPVFDGVSYPLDVFGAQMSINSLTAAPACLVLPVVGLEIANADAVDDKSVIENIGLFFGLAEGGYADPTAQWQAGGTDISGEAGEEYTHTLTDRGQAVGIAVLFNGVTYQSNTITMPALNFNSDLAFAPAAWYDASQSTITVDGTDTDQVTAVTDLSPNGRARATSATASERPLTGTRTINSLNAFEYVAGQRSHFLNTSGLPWSGARGFSVFKVFQFDALSNAIDPLWMVGDKDASNAGKTAILAGGTDGFSWRFLNGARVFGSCPVGTVHTLMFSRLAGDEHGECLFRLDGGAPQAQTSVTNGTNVLDLEANDTFASGTFWLNTGVQSANSIDGIEGTELVLPYVPSNAEADAIFLNLHNQWATPTPTAVTS